MTIPEKRQSNQSSPRSRRGFTLIELLVVISIIGILSTIAVISMFRAKEAAKISKSAADVSAYVTAIMLLGEDTGKWPNGCPIESTANPEVTVGSEQAGIISRPSVGDQGGGCFWSDSDVAKWNGPYAQIVDDPWGNPYWFDPDYRPYENCDSMDDLPVAATVLSFGPNGTGLNGYDCDDIFKILP